MGTITWGSEIAEVYDTIYSEMADPAVVDPMVTMLVELAEGARSSSSLWAQDAWRCP